ncbi:UvrD/REP helicase N-terminal domain-containing protein [Pedobacter westerhofensis]|uniref:DNA 3'-5' helicase II n=1 Tax=Pedobacter westerhofensis TaxID=425512 RepID=A0A521FQS9_9SPHI|nr:UvrD-helicase domain-containing protein [Pedobacter westerhofensis]SMO98542.1 UvrD/REP helicase N-terminal domain-containing protein [Pedobacter westerhofensis]
MLPVIDISAADYAYAEGILLPEGCVFDQERRNFIADFSSLDLQAVPGSGKTTAILAKLLILEKHLPIHDGSGILIISHTNAAIDEIRARLKHHCPKLLNYPNFLGTIQSFVDEFMAFPYFAFKFGRKIVRIDNELYNESIDRHFGLNIKGFTAQEQRNARYYLTGSQSAYYYRFQCNGYSTRITDSVNGKPVLVAKPKPNSKNYVDFSVHEKKRIRKWMTELKLKVMNDGVLHYDDAYFLANRYLQLYPGIKTIIQKRFSLVLVDEMQDMDKHQYDVLEQLFYENGQSTSIYQRIGDKNQAIFNGSAKLEDIWIDRPRVLALSGSQRLGPEIAALVKNFAIFRPQGFTINGLSQAGLKPHLLRYSDATITNVPQRFLQLITDLQNSGEFPQNPRSPIKIVAWNTEWPDGVAQVGRVRLMDYIPQFSKSSLRPTVDHNCLESYLESCDLTKNSLKPVRNSIINALLKILRLEGAKTSKGHRFSKQSMIDHIKLRSGGATNHYDEFSQKIYDCSLLLVAGSVAEACQFIKEYLTDFLQLFNLTLNQAQSFVDSPAPTAVNRAVPAPLLTPILKINGQNVEVTTVHAVKGQTHAATLYLETSYNGKHESEYLTDQILGIPFTDQRVRHKECVKMAYVGLSRPEHLLCIAIHKSRFDNLLSGINMNEWEVIDA